MNTQTWMDDFEAWLRLGDKSERTIAAYQGALGVFGRWFELSYGRPFAPRQLTATDVRSYRHELQSNRKLAASTVNLALAALRMLAKWAMEAGALAENPAEFVSFVDEMPRPPRWLTRAELRRLMAEFERSINDADVRGATERARQGRRDLAMTKLMAGAGLRIGEAVALDLDDVEIGERSGYVFVREGKGRRQRKVGLSVEVREGLKSWLGARGQRPGALFTSQKGGRLTPRAFQRTFAEKASRAGLEEATPHSLRHFFVKRTIDNGQPLTVAAELAGHSRVQTTARYAKPGRLELDAAVEGLF